MDYSSIRSTLKTAYTDNGLDIPERMDEISIRNLLHIMDSRLLPKDKTDDTGLVEDGVLKDGTFVEDHIDLRRCCELKDAIDCIEDLCDKNGVEVDNLERLLTFTEQSNRVISSVRIFSGYWKLDDNDNTLLYAFVAEQGFTWDTEKFLGSYKPTLNVSLRLIVDPNSPLVLRQRLDQGPDNIMLRTRRFLNGKFFAESGQPSLELSERLVPCDLKQTLHDKFKWPKSWRGFEWSSNSIDDRIMKF